MCRFSSITERYFLELDKRRSETVRSETLSIIHGMRYLKLDVCSTLASLFIHEGSYIVSAVPVVNLAGFNFDPFCELLLFACSRYRIISTRWLKIDV